GEFEMYEIEGSLGGHGFGAGDVNGDGRMDLLFDGGWMEAPENPFDAKAWTAHKEWEFGPSSVPILVYDVNTDGKPDVIVGQAHNYGLDWYEQGADGDGNRTWTKHEIEPGRSQFHDLALADVDNDGQVELVTGKRYRAHNGHDPGSADPLGLYYYNINGGDFERITLDYGPHEQASGAGIYLWIADVDGNGWQDIVAPGKEGLYLFKNMGKQAQASAE
ncbi:MAG: VCBS repeat-containing protein, partial [Candidatus Hydrogenedentes bacterium]|nr:VCBS repeat-containing protein [Candidatus Hydrogenedentota bacterium]